MSDRPVSASPGRSTLEAEGKLFNFVAKLRQVERDVFVNVASAALDSIQNGSAVTGAPGQPVDTGFLKGSWQLSFPSDHDALIATDVAYAAVIEHGVKEAYDYGGEPRPPQYKGVASLGPRGGVKHIKSTVGGQHSVALTHAGMQRIVDDETRKLVGADG